MNFILKRRVHRYISEMAGESKNDKSIICNKRKCKYINAGEHISTDFGYTRLEGRYKTCKKCRARRIIIITNITITIKKN